MQKKLTPRQPGSIVEKDTQKHTQNLSYTFKPTDLSSLNAEAADGVQVCL